MSSLSFEFNHVFKSSPSGASQRVSRPEFPLDAMPRPVSEFALSVWRSFGCPLECAAAGCLAAMSGAIGATRQLEIQPGWREQASLYICLLGPSGSGKTPALFHAVRPLIAVTQELAQSSDRRSAAVTEATTEALSLLLR